MDAISLLDLLKNHPVYKAIPVVVHTTELTPSKKDELLDKGTYACMKKLTLHQDMLQMVRDLKDLSQKTSN